MSAERDPFVPKKPRFFTLDTQGVKSTIRNSHGLMDSLNISEAIQLSSYIMVLMNLIKPPEHMYMYQA